MDLRWHRSSVVCLLLVLLTLAVYYRLAGYEFINYDDDLYVTANAQVQKGLTLQNMLWAFTATEIANWHPLTWLSHQLDVQLWAMDSGGHHLTSLLFHIANGLVLFLALNQMTGAFWRSAAVAAVFVWHPINVESVAWVAERKNVLSTFFWLLTMWSYSRYAENPARRKYLAVLLFFLLGLMAKPMLVTLPFVLLLLDYWPLKRFQFKAIFSLIREKIPLFVLAAASCWVTFLAQHGSGAVRSLEAIPLTSRLANALVSYVAYIGKMILPLKLAVFYPFPAAISGGKIAGAGAILIFFSGLAWKARMRHPYVTVGWLWYLGTLVPVIGFVQLGAQAMADRYAYIPLIGLLMAIVWSIPEIRAPGKKWIAPAAVLAMGVLGTMSWIQAGYWENSIALYRHAIKVTDDNYLAYNNLGNSLLDLNKDAEAKSAYEEALKIYPSYADAHYNMGRLFDTGGKPDAAITHYEAAIKYNPGFKKAYYNLGNLLVRKESYEQAIGNYRKAIQIDPDCAEAHNNLGVLLVRQGKIKEAVSHFLKAVQLNEGYVEARENLRKALSDIQRIE